ncbi:MAG: EAL domain-containing protein [Actinomycetota bacterium]|nr:EAL domain-containing protein [Actinomycetota bacterium]
MSKRSIGAQDLLGILDDGRGDVVVVHSPDGVIAYASRSVEAMAGWKPSSLIGRHALALVHADDRLNAASARDEAMRSPTPAIGTYRLRRADGTYLWVESLIRQVSIPDDPDAVMLCSFIRDIAHRKVLEAQAEAEAEQRERVTRELARSERRLAEAQAIGGTGSWEYDLITLTFTGSDQLCRIYDRPVGATLSTDEILALTHPDDRDRFGRAMLEAYERRSTFAIDHRIVWADGTERIVHTRGAYEADESGQLVRVSGTAQDVTEAKHKEQELRIANERLQQLATTDALTGLPNRALLDDRLDQALALARRENRKVALLYLDLDQFKEVNDSLGHQAGDDLLIEVAARLRGVLRDSDTAARVGGDEFAILLSGPDPARHAATTAQRLLTTLRASFTADGVEVLATTSIGIALWPDDGISKDHLLRHADVAMYRAKRAGGNRFEMYRPAKTAAARDRLSLDAELRRAIDGDQLFLRYHPRIDLANGRVVAVEALLRWAHPIRGEVDAAQFVALAEETGLVVPIGQHVVAEACRQAARWNDLTDHDAAPRVAVSVAHRQLAEPGFATLVDDTLTRFAILPEQLEIEITESAMTSGSGTTMANLASIRSSGASLAIDGCGTGYSSLAHLRRCRVNRLKIDLSFVAGLDDPAGGDAAVVAATINLGHALGLEAVAEGVATEAQRQFLGGAGCDQAQGFLWTPPLLADELLTWLRAH